jgi:hypothetical protein
LAPHEGGIALAGLAVVCLLAAACSLAPVAAAALGSPGSGILLAAGGLWVWGQIGPSPSRSFLSGIVCILGFAATLGALLACILLTVNRLLA